MKTNKAGNTKKDAWIWSILTGTLLLLEVGIALFVKDAVIRPYGGDVLVTVLIGCFVRIFIPDGVPALPVFVFLFAAGVEICQYFDIVSILHLDGIAFFRILIGQTFSVADILCYAAGCVIFFGIDSFFRVRRTV